MRTKFKLLSLQCSTRVRHCLRSLVRVVEWCVSRLVRLRLMSKQSMEANDLPLTCHPSPSLTTFAFRSSEVRRFLFPLFFDSDLLGMFNLFLERTADVMAPSLSVYFCGLFVWVVSRLAGDRPMSPQFQKVYRPPLFPHTDRFP